MKSKIIFSFIFALCLSIMMSTSLFAVEENILPRSFAVCPACGFNVNGPVVREFRDISQGPVCVNSYGKYDVYVEEFTRTSYNCLRCSWSVDYDTHHLKYTKCNGIGGFHYD